MTARGSVVLVELASGHVLAGAELHGTPVTAVALGPAGRLGISASEDGAVRILDFDRTPDHVRLAGAPGKICVAAAAGQPAMAYGCADGSVHVWDGKIARETRFAVTGARPIAALALSPDGLRVVAGDAAGRLTFWERTEGHIVWTAALPGAARWIRFGPDGRLAVLVEPGNLHLLSASTGVEHDRLEFLEHPFETFALSSDGRRLCAADGGTLVSYELLRPPR